MHILLRPLKQKTPTTKPSRGIGGWAIAPVWCVFALLFPTWLLAGSVGDPARLHAPAEWTAPSGYPAIDGEGWDHAFAQEPAASQAPAIGEWTRSHLKPGESFTMTGTRFTLGDGGTQGSDTTVWLLSRGAENARSCQILQIEPNLLIAVIPSDLAQGFYLVWVENSAGVSLPVPLNRPVDLWLGPMGDRGQPGMPKRILGKNLSRTHGTDVAHVQVGGILTELTDVSPYDVGFVIPASLPPGPHEVRLHNGHGGAAGWSDPLTLFVESAWTRGPALVDVAPSGGDDQPTLQAAIDSVTANPDGGVVRLQPGTYRLQGEMLRMKPNVALQGAGREDTVIRIEFTEVRDFGIILANRSALEDFTLLQADSNLVYGPIKSLDYLQDIALRNIAFTGTPGTPGGRVWFDATRVEITGCIFERELAVYGRDHWIHNNTFYGSPYDWTEGCIGGRTVGVSERVLIERNHFETKDWPTGPEGSRNYRDFLSPEELSTKVWAKRIIVANGGNSRHHILRNTSRHVAVQDNKGEMILFHGTSSGLYAQVDSATATTVTIRTDGLIDGESVSVGGWNESYAAPMTSIPSMLYPQWFWPVDGLASAVIVRGTGLGQARRVVSHTADTLTLEAPWRVLPASDSVIVITAMARDNVVYGNDFDGFPEGYELDYSASCPYQLDGNGFASVIENNTARRTFHAGSFGGEATAPTFWCEARGNDAREIASHGLSHVAWSYIATDIIAPWVMANAFRENYTEVGTQPRPFFGPTQHVNSSDWLHTKEIGTALLFEGNTGIGGALLFRGAPAFNVINRRNTLTGSVSPAVEFSQPSRYLFIENNFTIDLPPDSAATRHTLFDPAAAVPVGADTDAYELGVRLTATTDGWITAIRFYKATGETGTHTGRVWSDAGVLLASAAFNVETDSGWQQAALSIPIAIAAGQTFIVSVNTNADSGYAYQIAGFAAPITNGPLNAPVGAGVFNTAPGAFPSTSFNNANYYRDVVFEIPAETPPPATLAAWQATHFTESQLADPLVSGPAATPAADGLPNLVKYHLGLDPWTPAPPEARPFASLNTPDADVLTLSYWKDRYVPDAVGIVEWSETLAPGSWSAEGVTVEIVEQTATRQHIEAHVPVAERERLFIRLRVTLTP